MLQVTIKDTKTNEVIYDEEVSMVFMQAAEKNSIRSIRHMTEDSDLPDILSCIKALRKAALEAKDALSSAFEHAFGMANVDDDK